MNHHLRYSTILCAESQLFLESPLSKPVLLI
jgi:hypothetical protein